MPVSIPTKWRGALALAAALLATTVPPLSAQSSGVRVHDPAIIEQDGTFYIFATGNGVSILRSTDLVHWEQAGRVFDALPAWAAAEVPGARGSLWAPDISHFDGRYFLYYSVSTFGGQRSAIGLATNTTLDPQSPAYRWVDQGMVLHSVPGVSTFNAIDPNLVMDEKGEPWLSWGSFWGGIKMRKLDRRTGKLSASDTTLYSLASRTGVDVTVGPNDTQSVEAPFIIRHGQNFYLFASYDMCCRAARSTYNVRVGRSAKVTGPYLDALGKPMIEDGGTRVLASEGKVHGPGHNSILTVGDKQYMAHHYYDAEDNGRSKLQIRPLTWTADGWPQVGAPLASTP